jgi:hypothetical protein
MNETLKAKVEADFEQELGEYMGEWEADLRAKISPPPSSPSQFMADRLGNEHSAEDGKFISKGAHHAATSAMKAAHPFPDGGPGFAVRHLRAYAANAIHRMLNEEDDPPVPLKPEAPVPKQVSLARKAIERVEEARGYVHILAGGHGDVVGAHSGGKAALEAARVEAKSRYEAALSNATAHVAALPPEVKDRAARQLRKATLEADEEPFGSLKRKTPEKSS